jgi:hypothetical protein
MARSRVRACLEDGLKLDLNRLAKRGFIKFTANIGHRGIIWTHSYWGEIANGVLTADMSDASDAWLQIAIGSLLQRIILVSRPRHFGGRQWYFQCPRTSRLSTVVWRPPCFVGLKKEGQGRPYYTHEPPDVSPISSNRSSEMA